MKTTIKNTRKRRDFEDHLLELAEERRGIVSVDASGRGRLHLPYEVHAGSPILSERTYPDESFGIIVTASTVTVNTVTVKVGSGST